MTMDSHEVKISSMLAGPGARCWRAIQLNLSIPFFFPTWVVHKDDLEVPERALLIYESDFLNLFESVGPQALRHVQYLAPMESDPERWEIRDLRKIWSATSADSVVGRNMFIEGVFAKLMYKSMYKMHELALHGWWRVARETLARSLTPSTGSKVKLH